MKKILILSFFVCFVLCGCTAVQDMTIEEIINDGTSNSVSVYNKYRKGYKYDLSKGIDCIKNSEYNEVLASSKYTYYLYVDAVSYYNKVIETYEPNDKSYISMPINYEDKYGYLEINEKDEEKYFIEIMYNYAKIEVMVNKSDINVEVSNAINILNSIKFNDNILKRSLDEESLSFEEYDFDIFETTTTTSDKDYLETIDDDIEEQDDEVHDSDLIE